LKKNNYEVKLTLFNGEGNNKNPISPYKDGSFLFITKTLPSLRDAFIFMVKHFTLSKPLNIDTSIKELRRKINLKKYSPNKIYNIAIDLDEIKTKDDYLKTIDYFKDNNYSIILGKSKGWNGKNKFNMKGILRVNFTNDENIIKSALSYVQSELGDSSKIDLSVAGLVSLQAPSKSDFIVHYNEIGKILSDSDAHCKSVEKTLNTNSITYDNEVIDECIKIFANLGYTPTNASINDNGSINFFHPSEVKSKGGYFWFSSNPLVMNHHNKDKSVSVFHLLKETKIGKEWLKNKTKQEQKNQLIKENDNIYNDTINVKERYLNFEKEDKIAIIEKFLKTEKSILKIKSAMGTAKSDGIKLTINKAHEKNLKVIVVSNRVSVAMDFAEKYNIMLYKDPESYKSKNSVVVQYDSLHRFKLSNYDVVIFDEFISLLLHHRSSLTDNANINAVKFNILMNNKKVLIADAFLTGYEDTFINNRTIYYINNQYRDNINLYEYKNKDYFIDKLISESNNLNDDEHISASFTSLNVMRVVEEELRKKEIRVVSLSSETSEITKNIIFNRFREKTHNAFDVILFTPTLTVGVSNLNNVTKHFHYDSGMSTDVISSLQMIKRSRTTKEIHFYLEERQMYYDTSINSINASAERNINNFYNKKDKTLLIDVDYETGDLKLTKLAKYINEIEVLYNILANNHANAFRILLNFQFSKKSIIIKDVNENFDLKNKIKNIKEKIKNNNILILEENSDVAWNETELDAIKNKMTDLTDSEKAIKLMAEIEENFDSKLNKKDLLLIANKEIETNFKYISLIKRFKVVSKAIKNDDYAKYILSKVISDDIKSLQNKNNIVFLEYLLTLKITELKKWYSKNDLKKIDSNYKKIHNFFKKIGYKWKDSKLIKDENIEKYSKFL